MNRTHQPKRVLPLPVVLMLAVCLGLAAPVLAAGQTVTQDKGTTIQLMKTSGTVGVSNSSGRSMKAQKNMRLYNGYHVSTSQKSYAWLNLDSKRVDKLDASSEVEIRKSGKNLEMLLKSGKLFFDIAKPLDDDETLSIRTSSMVMGVRGTCGWVDVVDQWTVCVHILEGEVACVVSDPVSGQTKSIALHSGETADFVVYPQSHPGDKCDIILEKYSEDDAPGFVLVELAADPELCEYIYERSGLDFRAVTAEEAGKRQAQDEAVQASRQEEINGQLETQESNVSKDPVWSGTTPSNSSSDSGGGTVPTANPTENVDVTNSPGDVNKLLDSGKDVAVSAGENSNLYLIDSDLTIPAGTTLTVQEDLTLAVESGVKVTVNGTLDVKGNVENNGTIVVNSGNSFHIGGSFLNKGDLISQSVGRIEAKEGVDNYGTITCAGTSSLYSSSTEGTVRMRGLSSALSLTGGDITNNSTSGPALALEEATQIGQVTFTEQTLMKSKTEGVLTVGETPVSVENFSVKSSSNNYKEFSITTYAVTFEANGGSGDKTIQVITGYSVGSGVPVPVRPGYELTGWNTAANGSGTVFTKETKVTADLTVYAQWQVSSKSYTIRFDPNGGTLSGDASISVAHNGTVSASVPVPPPGHSFYGWYTAEDSSGTRIDETAPITADATWYARWKAVSGPTVLLYPNGGSGTAQTVSDVGEEYTLPECRFAAPDGKRFTGWAYSAGGEVIETGSIAITGGTTILYAIWEDVTYTVNYAAGTDGTGSVPAGTKIHGVNLSLSRDTFTRTGYSQTGWATSDGGAKTYDLGGSYADDAAITLYPVWEINRCTVTFDPNQGTLTGAGSATVNYNETVTLPTAPTRTGYTFTSWNTAADGSGTAFTGSTAVTDNVTVYAQWSINRCTVTFDPNGGTLTGAGSATVNYNETVTLPTAPTRTGYTFTSWNTAADGTGTAFTDSTAVTDDVTVYAQWEFTGYTLTFEANGDSNDPEPVSGVRGTYDLSQVGTPAEPSGKSFAGWARSSSARVANVITTITPTEDTTLYAVWYTEVDSATASGQVADGDEEAEPFDLSGSLGTSDIKVVAGVGATLTVDSNSPLTIPSGSTLLVDSAVTLQNIGTITVESGGTLTVEGPLTNTGTITVNGTLNTLGTVTNSGTITVNSSNTLNVYGALTNKGTLVVTETGHVVVGDGGSIINSNGIFGDSYYGGGIVVESGGTLEGEGTVTNNGWMLNNGALDVGSYSGNGEDGWWEPWSEYLSDITSLTVGGGVGDINFSFSGNTNLTSVTIQEGVTEISGYTFSGCTNLKSVTIPNSVQSIGSCAFADCTSLKSITLPASVTIIYGSSFAGCTSLTSINVDENNTTFTSVGGVLYEKDGDKIYLTCYPAGKTGEAYTVKSDCTFIVGSAFEGNTSLKTVTIPASVTNIGYEVFAGCTSLTSIEVNSGNTTFTSVGGVLFRNDGKTLVCYPTGKAGAYTIPDGVTKIDESAFYSCTGLTGVTIPDTVTYIDQYAFQGCTDLTSVTIPSGVTRIEQYTFQGCTSLTSVSIPDGITYIDTCAFASCASLTSVTIPDSVIRIYGSAFWGCTGLTSVSIGTGVTSISGSAFEGCTGLTSVTIPASVTSIDETTFEGCTSLTSIEVAEGNETYASAYGAVIYKYTENDVNKKTLLFCPAGMTGDYTIPDGVTAIGYRAFDGCAKLTGVTIPDSVTDIRERAFAGCAGLTTVTIGSGVDSIGNGAFYGCDALTDVYYAGTEEGWSKISIGYWNDALTNATITYNYGS